MPHPIHYRVADAYVAITRNFIEIANDQADRIHEIIRSMPVRVTIDLLSLAENDIAFWPTLDSFEVEHEIANNHTPYIDIFMVILNEIRLTRANFISWFPLNSELRMYTLGNLRRMRELEENDGILPEELRNFYQIANHLEEVILNNDVEEDDNQSVASVESEASVESMASEVSVASTAITEIFHDDQSEASTISIVDPVLVPL